MKILGIVAEYNPFHNGHLYHLTKAKEIINPDAVVSVMSGNFIQRGEPALINKFERAKIALNNGIDLVIELPVYYSVATAEKFAYGGVKLLNECGVTDIVFGSEYNDITELKNIAHLLTDEPAKFASELKRNLDNGLSFPEARAIAVEKFINVSSSVLMQPNNILGIEYLKAIFKLNSSIEPHLVERTDCGYHDTDSKTNILSATGIREKLKENENIDLFVPDNVLSYLNRPVFLSDFEQEIMYKLRTMNKEDLLNIPDVTEGLENRILSAVLSENSLNKILDKIKTRRYPLTRIKRILISALLGISKINFFSFEKYGGPQYIRVLGMNDKGKEVLSQIKSSLPIVTSVSKFLTNSNYLQEEMIKADVLATNIYSLASKEKQMNLDYTLKL